MKHFGRIILGGFLCFIYSGNFAQIAQTDSTETQYGSNGKIRFVRIKPNARKKIENSISFLKDLLASSKDEDFILYRSTVDKKGYQHNTYQQLYKGLVVEGATYMTHEKNGLIDVANGNFKIIVGSPYFSPKVS